MLRGDCTAIHCPKNILNLCKTNKPVTSGADTTAYVWLLLLIYLRNQQYTITPATYIYPKRVGSFVKIQMYVRHSIGWDEAGFLQI